MFFKNLLFYTTPQNLWDAAKAVLRGKFIAIQSYLKKQETCQINSLTLHLKQLEKEEWKTPKVSRRQEIIKIRSEINEKEVKETIAKINKTKSWRSEEHTSELQSLAYLVCRLLLEKKKPGDKWKWKHNAPKSMKCSKSSSRRKFIAIQENILNKTRKISNK